MSTGLLLQYVLIGVIMLVSVLVVLRKLAPQLTNRWIASLAIRWNQPQRASWLRALARRMQPKQGSGDCSDGCSTCGACGPKKPAAAHPDIQPLKFNVRP